MSAIKSLFVAAILVASGMASAATVENYNISLTITYNDPTFSSIGIGTGTAVLDSAGLLTAQTTAHYLIYSVGVATPVSDIIISKVESFNGSLSGGVFTPTSGFLNNTSCYDNYSHSACAGTVPLGVDYSLISVSGQISVGVGGTVSDTYGTVGSDVDYQDMRFTPAVPVPAAMWLFGSGLIGLGGVARRCKSSSR